MKIQLKGWSWSLHDTIAASGPGGLKFQGAYTEFIMEQTEKYAVFDGANVCTIPNLCKLDEDEISSMAGVALECAIPLSNKFHGEDKEIFVSSGMPSDAATHVEDWTADSQVYTHECIEEIYKLHVEFSNAKTLSFRYRESKRKLHEFVVSENIKLI